MERKCSWRGGLRLHDSRVSQGRRMEFFIAAFGQNVWNCGRSRPHENIDLGSYFRLVAYNETLRLRNLAAVVVSL